MYNYEWDIKTNGYYLTNSVAKFVASEIRPVYSEELDNLNGEEVFDYSSTDSEIPLLWAKQHYYYYKGEVCAKGQIDDDGQYKIVPVKDLTERIKIRPVNIDKMVLRNKRTMDALVADTLKRIKEIYTLYQNKCEISYIGFSGGKDSMVLLDLCHQALPLSVPVIFSDTDMEFPDTISFWEEIQSKYSSRPFIKVKSKKSAIQCWEDFGPPSQEIRWCCSVLKNVPAVIYLHDLATDPKSRTLSFLGVRADESLRRSKYDDIGDGLKNPNQVNAMPLLSWGAQELFLYILSNKLPLNRAYRLGLPRVGCLMCPMATLRQSALIRKYYSQNLIPFNETIKKCISRRFASNDDFNLFVNSGGWHTRQSGITLNEVILAPSEIKTSHSITYNFPKCNKNVLIEWFKTLGHLSFDPELKQYVVLLKDGMLRLSFDENNGSNTITKIVCNYDNSLKVTSTLLKNIKSVIHKALGCVNCRACESECPNGALSLDNKVKVDTNKCIHCLRCHSTQEGCLRYYSKRYAGGLTMNISGINKYMTFGLKTDWLPILASEGENFRSTGALGNRMIPSAITWFREAKLITESKNIEPSHLMDYANIKGYDNGNLWDCIWISLANISPLVKWYVSKAIFNETLSPEDLNNELSNNVNSESVRKGALQSLFSMFKSSPLGTGANSLVKLELKGQRVISLTRIPRSIDKMAVLYSLYVMAATAERTSFTLSEMMTADFESAYISPLVAFGMSVDELKSICLGLSSLYPKFIACSFSLGLDEVKIFPETKTMDDVVDLMLQ